MAKIVFAPTVDHISGRVNTGVYYKAPGSKFGYMRQWVYPRKTKQNEHIGKVTKNMGILYLEADQRYIEDLKSYTKKFKHLPAYSKALRVRATSAFAVWLLMFWNWAKSEDPEVDLSGLVLDDLQTMGAKVRTIKDAVTEGFLPVVEGYEEYTNVISM